MFIDITTINMKYPIGKSTTMAKTNRAWLLVLAVVIVLSVTTIHAQKCNPSGRLRGKKPPGDHCNHHNMAECCKEGKFYATYDCSPPVTQRTEVVLTLNSFEKGGEGGWASQCDERFHSDKTRVVALSTGWYDGGKRCLDFITIHGNGKSVKAKVVDQCDSTMGCNDEHAYQPPCPNNIVDASDAVWAALGVPRKDWGWMKVTWSD
ncbi:hypothetical protein L6452_31586 [Arctium lappa]|uniref:Uncharacterized protein n=1 Tax=Arctium lappa TaxID=4217 RepID=A0ACB8Z1G4_ARCLA|nr:hypothetical protein L6452_31586 [Arctium lappa]